MLRILAIVAAAFAASPGLAASPELIEAARKEGSVTWYTTAIIDQFARPAVAAFEKKYGVRVDFTRGSNADISLRVSTEAKAGRILGDLVDGTQVSVVLRREGLIEKFIPPHNLPQRYVDPDGYWLGNNEYVLTPAYNTDLVPKEKAPKTFEDLLAPQWKGKMVWNVSPAPSAGQGFVGTVLAAMGEEKARAYLAKLATQSVTGVKASARQVLDQVIAGEYAIALQIFNNHAPISKARGAPIEWIAMEPAMAVLTVMSAVKGSPHPNAAKLLFEFIVSDEGQTIMAQAGELPVAPHIRALVPELRPQDGKFRATYLGPDEITQQIPIWQKMYDEYFR